MSASQGSVLQPTGSLGGATQPSPPLRWSNSSSGFEVHLPNSGNDVVNFTELAAALKVPQRYLAVNFRTQQYTILSRMDGDHLPGNFPKISDLWDKHCVVCDDIPTPSKLFVADTETACLECFPAGRLCVACVDSESNRCFLCYSNKQGWEPTTIRDKLLEDAYGEASGLIQARSTYRSPELAWHLRTFGDFSSEETTQPMTWPNQEGRFWVLGRQ
jgi:hypothetical protein